MKPSLQVRLSQHLALTPQLQQSIRLLQLSTLELHQEVGQMLDQNPFLEMEEEAAATAFETPIERQAADRVADRVADHEAPDAPADSQADAGEAATELRAEEFGTTEREDWENGTESDDFDGIRETPSSASTGEGDDTDAHDRRAGSGSLQDHLRAQLVGMRLTADDHAAIEVLIESLDGDGYLADTLQDIAERLAVMLGLEAPEDRETLDERLRCGLRWLQSLEPRGVGASSLGECLALQLKATPRCAARQVALRICDQYLELLAKRDMKRLTALTGADEGLVQRAGADPRM